MLIHCHDVAILPTPSYDTVDDFVKDLLENAHVAVVPGSAFGLADNVRISYSTSEEIMTEAITRIKNFVTEFQYLICVKMGEKTIVDFILERQITLRIWQSDGQSEKLDMFHKPVVSAASTSTLRGENNECSVFSLETNPELLEKIELKWARPFVTNVINVHHINMTALSYKKFVSNKQNWLKVIIIKNCVCCFLFNFAEA